MLDVQLGSEYVVVTRCFLSIVLIRKQCRDFMETNVLSSILVGISPSINFFWNMKTKCGIIWLFSAKADNEQ